MGARRPWSCRQVSAVLLSAARWIINARTQSSTWAVTLVDELGVTRSDYLAPDLLGDGERRRRYILCLNGEEAERQKWRRAALLETLEAELDVLKADHPERACRLLSSKRFGPYLSQDDNGRPYLDRDKVKRAEHLDGKYVLTTSPAGLWGPRTPHGDDTLSVADIALGYKGMWIIETCFRRMKTTGLARGAAATPQPRWEVRPMFHWMPQRIGSAAAAAVGLAGRTGEAADGECGTAGARATDGHAVVRGAAWARLRGRLRRRSPLCGEVGRRQHGASTAVGLGRCDSPLVRVCLIRRLPFQA